MKFALSLFALLAFTTAQLHAADTPAPGKEELEAKFKATMANVTMSGQWFPLQDGVLGAAKDDSYTIVSAEKQAGSTWIIRASMHGIVIPVPVEVQWAGDTAVIIVNGLQLPGGYTAGARYTARVLVHEHTYAGTWSGGDHGGLLAGVIKSNKPAQ